MAVVCPPKPSWGIRELTAKDGIHTWRKIVAATHAAYLRELQEKIDHLKSCPFLRYGQGRSVTCCGRERGRPCRRMWEKGLDDSGAPLPPGKRPFCSARTRSGRACRMRVVPGKRRCKFHGGCSTGPRTPEGKSRIAAAQRRRWEVRKAGLGSED